MNTLVHLAADIALLWFSIYAFSTLGEDALGVAILALFLAFVVLTLLALKDDVEIFGRGSDEE